MSTGATIAVFGVGVVVVGGLAYLALHTGAADPVRPLYASQTFSSVKPMPPGPPPPPPPNAASNLVQGVNSLNQAGCQLAASKVGAGALAATGCKDFLKYATPVGVAEQANKLLVKIPGVQPAENAVASLASKPINAVKSVFSSIF